MPCIMHADSYQHQRERSDSPRSTFSAYFDRVTDLALSNSDKWVYVYAFVEYRKSLLELAGSTNKCDIV